MSEHSSVPADSGAGVNDVHEPVVTIWEEYGAGADAIGRAVADKLGLPYHEQAFSSEDIESGADGPKTDSLESRAVLSRVFSAMGGAYGGFEGLDVVTTQREKRDLIANNNDTVWRWAEDGGVIVGRNATVILAARPRTVHVLLTGDVNGRVERAAATSGISADTAARRQTREDQVRSEMSRALYGWNPHQPDRYDLVINTSRLPEAAAAEAIVHAVQVRAS